MAYEIEVWAEDRQMVHEVWQKLSDVIRRVGELMDTYEFRVAKPIRKNSGLELQAPGKRIIVRSTEEDPEFDYFINETINFFNFLILML